MSGGLGKLAGIDVAVADGAAMPAWLDGDETALTEPWWARIAPTTVS